VRTIDVGESVQKGPVTATAAASAAALFVLGLVVEKQTR